MKGINRSNSFKGLVLAIKDGSYLTRLSLPFMGFGQLARGQIGKGLFYLLAQTLFIVYLLLFGGGYVLQL